MEQSEVHDGYTAMPDDADDIPKSVSPSVQRRPLWRSKLVKILRIIIFACTFLTCIVLFICLAEVLLKDRQFLRRIDGPNVAQGDEPEYVVYDCD